MELTFHALTANRTLPKAKVRNRAVVDIIETFFSQAEIPPAPFDVLQVLLMDHPKGVVRLPMKTPKDRIYQIEVGVGVPNFLTMSAEEFAAELVSACRAALNAAPFESALKAALLDCLAKAEG